MSQVQDLTQDQFDSTIESAQHPVLIDFSATWCQPCQQLAPSIDEVSKVYDGKLDVYKVDIDQSQGLAERFSVLGVPTCVFLHDKKEIDRFSGYVDLRTLKERIDKVLGSVR